LPWLKKKKVNIHVRNHKRYISSENIFYHELVESPIQQLVIIAAPVTTDVLVNLFKDQIISEIIDFRTLDQKQLSLKNQISASNIIELNDFFRLQEDSKLQIEKVLPLIKAEISNRVRTYLLRKNDQ